jgi:uncharacterized protein (TIGR03086 family)
MTELPDPRPSFAAALDQATAVVAAITSDDLGRPTPCHDYDVDALVRHLFGSTGRIAGLPAGRPMSDSPDLVDRLPDDLGAAYAALADEARQAWSDDGALTRIVTVPWGTFPGAIALGGFLMEIVVHTWDLADAISYRQPLDPALAEAALAVAHLALPAERRGEGVPFEPPVPVDEEADAYLRLAAWVGRQPVRV